MADGDNHRVRKVDTATGDVDTLAGTGAVGRADGHRGHGQLFFPSGVASSHSGKYLYIADTWNFRIRAIDVRPGAMYGFLTTVAGQGTMGYADGSRRNAQFNLPRGVAVSMDGATLYVADTGNHRSCTPASTTASMAALCAAECDEPSFIASSTVTESTMRG